MKILLFDIETAPSIAYMWSLWSEIKSTTFLIEDWYILCWSAKWLGEKKIFKSALPDFSSGYKKDPRNDCNVVKALWDLLDKADVVIAHNGIKYDKKRVNTRFITHGMTPPSPYKMIDTLQLARNQFAFTSNRLDDLGTFLGVGKKIDTGGFQLWKDCLAGNKQAWNKMVKYCQRDVTLLEQIYLKMRPFMLRHPNLSIRNAVNGKECCPKCLSINIVNQGYCYTATTKYQRFKCKNCGGWGRRNKNLLDKSDKVNITKNII